MAVSLRVPEDVKKRITRLVEAGNTTAHAFMLDAIRDKVEAEEARATFYAEAEKRLMRMRKSGKGIPAVEVFAYFDVRAQGKSPPRPKPRKMP